MKKSLFIPLILMLLATVGSAEKGEKVQPSKTTAGEEINWEVISQGGTDGGSASYQVAGTVTQTAVGYGSSASYQLNQGFWQSFEECPGRGDATGDGNIDVADVMFLINYLFTGTSAPDPMCNGDANCDGIVDVADVMYLINYLFTGTSPPGCWSENL